MKRKGNALVADKTFSRLDIEAWIIRQLGDPPCIRAGDTNFAERQSRIRDWIISHGLQQVVASTRTRETWASVYLRFYGEALENKSRDSTRKGNSSVTPTQ